MSEHHTEESVSLRVESDLIAALKSRDQITLNTLRLLKSSAKNAEVAKRRPLTEDEYGDVIRQQVKMRRDAAAEYDKAGRSELAQRERAESTVLQRYLPAQADVETVRQVVLEVIGETGATGPGDVGKVMSGAMRALKGRADGAVVNATVREILAAKGG